VLYHFRVIWRSIIVTLKKVTESHSNCMVPFESLGAVFYSPAIVTMAVSLTVDDTFSVKEQRDLENWVRGCSRSLKMGPFDRPYTTFYWSAIVYIALSGTAFALLDVEKYHDLEIWVKGHWRSFKLVPLERLSAVSYLFSIVTMAVSLTVYEIFSVKECVTLKTGLGVVQGHWRWRRSIDHIRLSIGPPL